MGDDSAETAQGTACDDHEGTEQRTTDKDREEETARSLVNIRTGPATEEEKKLLRSAQLVRKATSEEVEAWFAVSQVHMSEKSKTAFHGMNAENQYRVMYEGPLTESKDSTEILYARIQRFMDMENQLKKLANATDSKAAEPKQPKEKKVSELAMAIGKALVSTDLPEEVPENERRFAAPVGTAQPAPQPKAAAPLVGRMKGVGGIVEAIQKKYGMQKGERAKVLAETKELWKLAGERTVPKTQCNQGWKWVLQGVEDAAAKRKAEAQKAKAAPEATAKAPEDARTTKDPSEARERSRSRDKKGRSRVGSEERRRSRGESRRRSEAKKRGKEKDGRDERKGRRRRRSSSSEPQPARRRSPSTSRSRHKRRRR